jgi:ribosomal protein L11 methyltransferase
MARVGLEQVVAIDPDPEAIEAAQHNVSLNDVSERVRIRRIPVEGLREGEFDLVVANLTGPILRRSSHVLRRRLSPNGILLVSGFLEEEVEAVERPFLRRGLKLLERRSDEMWCALWMKCGG